MDKKDAWGINTINVISKWLLSILLILPLIGTGFSARADTRVVLNEKAVAKTGTKITDFVPGGWKIVFCFRAETKVPSAFSRSAAARPANTMVIATFHISLNPEL